ncbi:MAG: hypothetical protein IJ678_09000 [Kiritimatiellae bacterium]|nr:hypothetical protein [Kiritimatiellia bacterium]
MPPAAKSQGRRGRDADWAADLPFETVLLHRVTGLWRNLAETVFPGRAAEAGLANAHDRVVKALVSTGRRGAEWAVFEPGSPRPGCHSGFMSFDGDIFEGLPLPPGPEGRADKATVALSAGASTLALVNAEDHLSLFYVGDGPYKAQLKQLQSEAGALDRELGFAKSEEYGWLSANPDHAGAGLVLSCDVCLFGLCVAGTLDASLRALDRLGFSTTPIFEPGPDSNLDAPGCLYRIASIRNAGSEDDIAGRMDAVCREVARQEQNARISLVRGSSPDLRDFLARSVATGAYAATVGWEEAVDIAQAAFFAADCSLLDIPRKSLQKLKRFALDLSPEVLAEFAGKREIGAAPEEIRAAALNAIFRPLLRQLP